MEQIAIKKIKPNPNNPRVITDDQFEKLVKSIQEFPEMLKMRPIVVDTDMVALGGNMRLKACTEVGLKEVPFVMFTQEMSDKMNVLNKTEKTYLEHCEEFIIKDNVSFGEWDWGKIRADWDNGDLDTWGLEVFDGSDVDIEEFFSEDNLEPEKEDGHKITLNYNEEDYNKIVDACNVIGGSKEKIIFGLLIEK